MSQYRNLSQKQVEKLAQQLATEFKNRGAVIGLIGDLGAGKTTFIKAFAKVFGIRKIHSPTFVITHQYPLSDRELYHLDFYRLTDDKQLTPLGLDEILSSHNIVLIEWVDRFPKIRKRCDILITLKVAPHHKRHVTIEKN